MASFMPLYDRVLVLPLESVREMNGVILPDSSREDHKIGIVLSVGEGYVSETGAVRPLRLKCGQKVVFGPWAGIPLQVGEETCLVLREGEITGYIPDE